MSFETGISQAFPKIICIGKNYLKHVQEMGGSKLPTSPVVFLKPWSSLSYNPKILALHLAEAHKIDHELELGVWIKFGGKNIAKEEAFKHVGGYFIGIDFTDRDLQKHAKTNGLPWTLSKGQDNFCPVSALIDQSIDPYQLELELLVNDVTRQKDIAGNMHFKIDEIISYTSSMMSLCDGDLILTGTPEGVGEVRVGDHVKAHGRIGDQTVAYLDFTITK